MLWNRRRYRGFTVFTRHLDVDFSKAAKPGVFAWYPAKRNAEGRILRGLKTLSELTPRPLPGGVGHLLRKS